MLPLSKKGNYEMEIILFDNRTHLTDEWESGRVQHRYSSAMTLIRISGTFAILASRQSSIQSMLVTSQRLH